MLNNYDGLSRNAVPWSVKTMSVIGTPCNLFAVDFFHSYICRHRCKRSDSIGGENNQTEPDTGLNTPRLTKVRPHEMVEYKNL